MNLKLFAPEPNRARTVLLFIIRDKSVTPIPVVAKILMDDLKSVWDTMSKPEQYKGSSITDFFDVQVRRAVLGARAFAWRHTLQDDVARCRLLWAGCTGRLLRIGRLHVSPCIRQPCSQQGHAKAAFTRHTSVPSPRAASKTCPTVAPTCGT